MQNPADLVARGASFRIPSEFQVPGRGADGFPLSRNGLDDVAGSGWKSVMSGLVAPGGEKALRTLDEWLEEKGRQDELPGDVGSRLERHIRLSEGSAHTVSLSAINTVAFSTDPSIRTDHALRRPGAPPPVRFDGWDLEASNPGNVAVRDFYAPWAMTALIQHCLDRNPGHVPRWKEVLAFLIGQGRSYYLEPLREAWKNKTKPFDSVRGLTWDQVYDGFCWRFGCAYYSCLREWHLMAALRERHGIQVTYHLLADMLFKVDFFVDDVLVALFIKNKHFRMEDEGRKERAHDKMDVSRFKVLSVELETPLVYGYPVMLSNAQVAGVASDIRAALGGRA